MKTLNTQTKTPHRKKRKIHHPRRRTPPGAVPGTLIVDPHAPQPIIRVMAYGPHKMLEEELQNVQDVHEVQRVRPFLAQWPVTWVHVEGLGNVEMIAQLGQIFGLHQLALEDVVNEIGRAHV